MMRLKALRSWWSLAAGARSQGLDTVFVHEDVAALRMRRPVSDAESAVLEEPALVTPLMRRFRWPSLDLWPLRTQLRLLLPLLALSLLLAFVFMMMEARTAASYAVQSRLVSDSLMHSQRLARSAPEVVRGDAEALRQLAESRDQMTEAIALLRAGGSLSERRVERLDAALQPALTRAAGPWRQTDRAVSTLVSLHPQLATIAAATRTVLDAYPRLVEQSERLTQYLATAQGAPADVLAASQLLILAHKLPREVGVLSDTEAATLELARMLARDAVTFRETLQGLLTRTEGRSSARDATLRSLLQGIRTDHDALAQPIAALTRELPKLATARIAASEIAVASEPLRAELLALQTELVERASGSGPYFGAMLFFLALAVSSGALLARVYYQDLDRRAAEALAQRAQAERLEQEAKQTNERNQAAILQLMNEIQELADGDLTIQATVTYDVTGAIADAVNYTVEQLRILISGINRIAELLATSSASAQSISTQLLAESDQQSEEIRETGHAVLQMAQQIEKVSESAAESAGVARQSLAAADQGRRAVQNAIAGMDGIRDQIQETAKRIKRLGESSQEIGEIVDMISEITEQTNVLALNAAIQAASAGEAGRGFTVVAEEVQRLAERSASATRQISGLIRSIQIDTQDAVAAMERSTQGVVAGTRLSDEAGNALTEIGRVSHRLAEMIEVISRTTSEQAGFAGTVAKSIQRILLVTNATSKATRETAVSIHQVDQLARALKHLAARFRIQK